MPFSHAEAWISQNPKRFYAILVVIALIVWTGQTYVWNPFWTFGYEYYPISMFFIAGGLGFLLPKRKRPEKQALEHIVQEIKATPPLEAYGSTRQQPQTESDPLPPPPLESLRDDDER